MMVSPFEKKFEPSKIPTIGLGGGDFKGFLGATLET
jgi:hypothetical protein